MTYHRGAIKTAKLNSLNAAQRLEEKFRRHPEAEAVPVAIGTGFRELLETVFPDSEGPEVNPVLLVETVHPLVLGVAHVVSLAYKWYLTLEKTDVISVSGGIEDDGIHLSALLRIYGNRETDFAGVFNAVNVLPKKETVSGNKVLASTENASEQLLSVDTSVQEEMYRNTPDDVPFLNRLSSFNVEPYQKDSSVYKLSSLWKKESTLTGDEEFTQIFRQCVSYLTTVEYNAYVEVLNGRMKLEDFYALRDRYIEKNLIRTGNLPAEDVYVLNAKIENALFDLYIIQDLISNCEDITDIKITDPESIRFRIRGKAYLSDMAFIDDKDYLRFVERLAIGNHIDLTLPTQTFTDKRDPNYILRFTITSSYITGSGYPIIHIRKISRKKLLGDDLVKAGMFDDKVKNYLISCGKNSKGVVFAGAPGCGKSICLNWFLEEAYEDSAEILVIQENDELFSYRKGVMFEHVVSNPRENEKECSLEDLGKMSLVAGANVFIIGEVKGGEICSAITLSNSGCRTALTIHSPSASETVDKMADLALRGYADSFLNAKRMMKSFQTIVYLKDFKVTEIVEILGFDENKKDMIYKKVYERQS